MKLVGSERPGARTATAAPARSPLHIVVAALPPPSWTLGLRYHRDCPLKSPAPLEACLTPTGSALGSSLAAPAPVLPPPAQVCFRGSMTPWIEIRIFVNQAAGGVRTGQSPGLKAAFQFFPDSAGRLWMRLSESQCPPSVQCNCK